MCEGKKIIKKLNAEVTKGKNSKFLPSIYLHKRPNSWNKWCSAKLLAKTPSEPFSEITGSTGRRKKFLC